MVVWQFTTIAALIGALLIYVMVLTNRLGTTNALLKRIEEGLVRPQPVTENLPAGAAEVVPARPPVPLERTVMEQTAVAAPVAAPARAAEMEVEDAPAAEVAERDRRVSYLTVRDLKVIARSSRRSSDTPAGVSPLFNEVFGRKHAQAELAESPAETVESSGAHDEQTAPHLEVVVVGEPMFASIESPAVVEELAVATYEIQDFLETTPSPDVAVVEHESVAFEPTITEPAAVEPVAAIDEPVILTPATEPHMATVVSEPSAPPPDIVAANEDQAPAEAPAAAATKSEAVDAAALEEKRRRDLLMHAQRRRRRLR